MSSAGPGEVGRIAAADIRPDEDRDRFVRRPVARARSMVTQVAGESVRWKPGQAVVTDIAQEAPPDGILDFAPLPAPGHLAEVREGQAHARFRIAERDVRVAGSWIHRGRELQEVDVEPALVIMAGQGVVDEIMHGIFGHPLEAEVAMPGSLGQ